MKEHFQPFVWQIPLLFFATGAEGVELFMGSIPAGFGLLFGPDLGLTSEHFAAVWAEFLR